jgi:hypothetical protein
MFMLCCLEQSCEHPAFAVQGINRTESHQPADTLTRKDGIKNTTLFPCVFQLVIPFAYRKVLMFPSLLAKKCGQILIRHLKSNKLR